MLAGNGHAWQAGHNLEGVGPLDPFQEAEMVSVSKNGVGDLLIFPFYMAAPEFSTKISVVNTDRNNSTVAKVVVRAHEESNEVLDFYIYLSPADMWTGYIYFDAATGDVVFWSDDDSIEDPLTGFVVPGTGNPFEQRLRPQDDNWMGYVEVYNVAAYDFFRYGTRTAPTPAPNWGDLRVLGTDKQDIYNWFWADTVPTPMISDLNYINPLPGTEVCDILNFPNNYQRCAVDRNILTGWMDVRYGNSTPDFDNAGVATASLRATVLKDFWVTQRPGKTRAFELNNASVFNNLSEVEAVLSADAVYLPYKHDDTSWSAHILNMPTKANSLIFDAHSDRGNIPYYHRVFDLQENTLGLTVSPLLLEDELELITTYDMDGPWWYRGNMFEEGWIDYEFRNHPFDQLLRTWMQTARRDAGIDPIRVGDFILVDGLPVIPMHFLFDGYGFSLSYGAKSDTFSIITDYAGVSVNDPLFTAPPSGSRVGTDPGAPVKFDNIRSITVR